MKNDSHIQPLSWQMERARHLMNQGRTQEALVLTLEALLEALDHLRDSLISMQEAMEGRAPASFTPEDRKPELPEKPKNPRSLQ